MKWKHVVEHEDEDLELDGTRFGTAASAYGGPDARFWWLSAGISQNFFGIGKTVLFGEYGEHKGGLAQASLLAQDSSATNAKQFNACTVATAANGCDSTVTSWGFGVNQYVDAAAGDWFVHFQRIDDPAKDDYAIAVEADDARHQGVFTGTLPAGVYAFRTAARDHRHFDAGVTKVPFEVQPGEVRDAGHYALTPLQSTE